MPSSMFCLNIPQRKMLSRQFSTFFFYLSDYRATFETKFVAPMLTVLKPCPFEKKNVNPKIVQNHDFFVLIQCKLLYFN